MPKLYTRRNTNRILQHDYSAPGPHFITIYAENRKSLFGRIENGQMILNDIGDMINFWLGEIPVHFAGIELDQYAIMPNHIHIITNIVGVDRCVDPLRNNKISDDYKINHSGRGRPRPYGII